MSLFKEAILKIVAANPDITRDNIENIIINSIERVTRLTIFLLLFIDQNTIANKKITIAASPIAPPNSTTRGRYFTIPG